MKWHSFPAVRWALFRIRGPRSYAMTSGSSSYSVSWLCKKKKTWWTCRLYSVGLFLSLFFSLSVKKASKARKDLQSIHEGNGATLPPHSARPHPPPPSTFFLRCRVDLSPSSAACSLCTVMYSPPPPRASFSFCICIYILCVCFYCLMRAGTHLVLSEGGRGVGGSYLCSCACLFSFSTCDDSGELLLSFPLFPIVSLLYVFTPRLHVWMASPSLVPLVYFCLNLFFFVLFCFCLHLQPERDLQSSSLLNIANLATAAVFGKIVWIYFMYASGKEPVKCVSISCAPPPFYV